jgi:hypothetical protein
MFATHDDLATAEFQVLESRRKIAAQARIIDELRRRDQPTQLAQRFLSRLEQALELQRRERDAIFSRIRGEIDRSAQAFGDDSVFPSRPAMS